MPDTIDGPMGSLLSARREMVTSRGEEFETGHTDEEAAQIVLQSRSDLDSFFVELAEEYHEEGELSGRQLPYLHKGALVGSGEWKTALSDNRSNGTVGGFGVIIGHFDSAHENGLKYPSITIQSEAPAPGLRMYRAGHKSSRPGSVAVTDAEGETFWGRIRRNGTFHPRDTAPDWAEDILRDFAEDPDGMARLEGRQSGKCCFCGLKLTESGSVQVGYGPVCAGNFGLPHPQH